MTALTDALTELVGLQVAGLRGYRVDQKGQAQLPAFLVGPPELAGGTYCTGPDTAAFPVLVVGRLDSTAMEVLFELVPAMWEAIENDSAGSVSKAIPTGYPMGESTAAAYELTVDYPL